MEPRQRAALDNVPRWEVFVVLSALPLAALMMVFVALMSVRLGPTTGRVVEWMLAIVGLGAIVAWPFVVARAVFPRGGTPLAGVVRHRRARLVALGIAFNLVFATSCCGVPLWIVTRTFVGMP